METLLWFVSDSRGGLKQTVVEKEQEYQQHQLNVLATARDMQEETVARRQESDMEENGDDSSLTIMLEDPPLVPKTSLEDAAVFEMKDVSENDESLDDSIKQEIQMKETNRRAYFDTLDDILE